MATYLELDTAGGDADLLKKITVAIMIAAQELAEQTSPLPTADDRRWIRQALYEPESEGLKALRYILAKNNTAAIGVITGADDATIQTQVDAIVPTLVQSMAGT
jgi:hypothetical protein